MRIRVLLSGGSGVWTAQKRDTPRPTAGPALRYGAGRDWTRQVTPWTYHLPYPQHYLHPQAINFIVEHNDDSLFDHIIDYCIPKPVTPFPLKTPLWLGRRSGVGQRSGRSFRGLHTLPFA